MAPRKAAKFSSKPQRPSAAAKKVNSAGKKRKAAAPPPLPAAPPPAPTTAFVLIKSEGYVPDGFHSNQAPTISTGGVYYSEDQAYAAAIRKFITELERMYGSEKVELRRIATTKGLSLKQRLKNIESAGELVEEILEFKVKKTRQFPQENVDEEKLLDEFQRHEASEDEFRSDSDGAASSPPSGFEYAL